MQLLTNEQKAHLHAIHTAIWKKYRNAATESIEITPVEKITPAAALAMAGRGRDAKLRAQKILADNQKLIIATEKERSAQRSRAVRDALAWQKGKTPTALPTRAAIDEEIAANYRAWLMQFPTTVAYDIFTSNSAMFTFDLGTTQYTELLNELNARRTLNA